jgi:hypothetical protein
MCNKTRRLDNLPQGQKKWTTIGQYIVEGKYYTYDYASKHIEIHGGILISGNEFISNNPVTYIRFIINKPTPLIIYVDPNYENTKNNKKYLVYASINKLY